MAFQTVDDLPEVVRAGLPQHAQAVYLEAYNKAEADAPPGEPLIEGAKRCVKAAWDAVKRKYTTLGPRGGMWVRKAEGQGVTSMPYKSIDEINPDVRKVLPTAAQHIYMAAFNAAIAEYEGNEGRSHGTAWAAIKNAGYVKDDKTGLWHKKAKEGYGMSLGMEGQVGPQAPMTMAAQMKQAMGENLVEEFDDLRWGLNGVLGNILRSANDVGTKTALIDAALAEFSALVKAKFPDAMAKASEVARIAKTDATKRLREAGRKQAPASAMERVVELFPATSVEALGEGDYRIEFLAHGFTRDGKRYYPKATQEAAAAAGTFDGAKMYFNHSDPKQDTGRGHRDLREWAATIKPGTVTCVEGNLQAICHAHAPEALVILEDPIAKGEVGLSHDSLVRMKENKIDGKPVHVVEAIVQCFSVDLVPTGNARGRVLEGAPDYDEEAIAMAMTEEDVREMFDAFGAALKGEVLAEVKGTVVTAVTEALKAAAPVAPPPDPKPEAPPAPVAPAGMPEDRVNEALAQRDARIKELEDERAKEIVVAEAVRIASERTDLTAVAKARAVDSVRGQIIARDLIGARVTEALDRERNYELELLRASGVSTQIKGAGTSAAAEGGPSDAMAQYERELELERARVATK